MKNFLYIAAFTLAISLFYTGVGQLLPQLESHPPRTIALVDGDASTPDDRINDGAGVFEANCQQCHKIGRTDRCPDMAGVGARAKDRAKERAAAAGKAYDDADYLLESICRPGDYLVKGYANIMPPQGKLLTGGQMMAVVAFLQDQGGSVTVGYDRAKAEERLNKFGCIAAGGAGGAPAAAAPPVGPPDKAFTDFGCVGCHSITTPNRLIGPSLMDVGKRLDRGQIYEAILAPDATLAQGTPPYPAGLMKGTLDGNGFYQRMTPADYKALVDWLSSHKG